MHMCPCLSSNQTLRNARINIVALNIPVPLTYDPCEPRISNALPSKTSLVVISCSLLKVAKTGGKLASAAMIATRRMRASRAKVIHKNVSSCTTI